ncbi:hypothetical protein B4098_0022 [Heyndrickxia coagulans]|uniref:Uncharacterized protein n=1 Tax=Heyndrickxia coagulans TaxID=1398 RepID=A0A150JRC4_HEYCO|nr:hypothetical protein B4098_0022 [Heyndrickxia coagulans]
MHKGLHKLKYGSFYKNRALSVDFQCLLRGAGFFLSCGKARCGDPGKTLIAF